MFMEHLALTYKCHSSIGNSLDLKVMLKEVLTTFVEDTSALNGFFYLIDENNKLYQYLCHEENSNFDENLILLHLNQSRFVNVFNFENKEILLIPLEKGIIVLIYENKDINFEFIISMFQDLIVKLNISIDACLSVQLMKNKNKVLNHLASELKEQQKQLIESDKYKSNFLANMSHELKTPLNSIIVISSIMGKNKNNKLDEEQIKNMKIINSCGNDLLILINDILDISKIEAGEISISLNKVNLNELLEELINEMNPLATEKGLILEFNCLLTDISLLTDIHRMKQIIKNLISNAIKFTEQGIIDVVLEENANDITIKVIDEGIGIAKDKLNHIFERFKQADGSTTRKYGGTGLGLSISKELALLLGGDLKAFSTLNEGSTFELILPKKTNIKNISDDKVSISSRDDDIIIEDIVFFDMDDVNVENNIVEEEKKILVINSDYASFFSIAVFLKKQNINITYNKSLEDDYLLIKETYDLIVINMENYEFEIDDFISFCEENQLKYIVISSDEVNDNYLKKELIKTELLNKILAYLGK